MTIRGELNLSLISEAMNEMVSTLESKIMNQKFDSIEQKIVCSKLKHARKLQGHFAQASSNPSVYKSLIIE